jgi:hypothetical protein
MFSFNEIDNKLNLSVKIVISPKPDPVSGMPSIFSNGDVPIQFPPRITDDSKSAIWDIQQVKQFEPISIFHGSEARRIGIEFTYVVTGGTYTTSYIANICHLFKAYFYRPVSAQMPIVTVHLYDHVGPGATFRMNSVSVSHGDTIIKDGSGTFPLLTKIKADMALSTNIEKKLNINGLPDKPEVEWY